MTKSAQNLLEYRLKNEESKIEVKRKRVTSLISDI